MRKDLVVREAVQRVAVRAPLGETEAVAPAVPGEGDDRRRRADRRGGRRRGRGRRGVVVVVVVVLVVAAASEPGANSAAAAPPPMSSAAAQARRASRPTRITVAEESPSLWNALPNVSIG